MVEVLRGRENARREDAAARSLPTPHLRRFDAAPGTPGTRPRPPTRVSHPERVGRLRGVGRDRSGRPHGASPPRRRSLTPGPGEGPRRRRPCRAGGLQGGGPGRVPENRAAPDPSGVPGRPTPRAERAPRPRRAPCLPRPSCGSCSAGATGACPRPGSPRVRPSSAGAASSKLRPSGPAAAKWAAPRAPQPRRAVAAPARRAPRVPARPPPAPRGAPLPLTPPPPAGPPSRPRLRRCCCAAWKPPPAGAAHERAKSMQLRRGRGPRRQRRPRRRPARRCLPPPGLKALVGKDTDVSMFAYPGEGRKALKFSVWLPSRAMILQLCPPRGALGVPPRPRRGLCHPHHQKLYFQRKWWWGWGTYPRMWRKEGARKVYYNR